MFKPLWSILMKGVAVRAGDSGPRLAGGKVPAAFCPALGKSASSSNRASAALCQGQLAKPSKASLSWRENQHLVVLRQEDLGSGHWEPPGQGLGPDPLLKIDLVQGPNSKGRLLGKERNSDQGPGEGRWRVREMYQSIQRRDANCKGQGAWPHCPSIAGQGALPTLHAQPVCSWAEPAPPSCMHGPILSLASLSPVFSLAWPRLVSDT